MKLQYMLSCTIIAVPMLALMAGYNNLALAQNPQQILPSQGRTVVLLHVRADRGVECGLLSVFI